MIRFVSVRRVAGGDLLNVLEFKLRLVEICFFIVVVIPRTKALELEPTDKDSDESEYNCEDPEDNVLSGLVA